MIVRRHDGETLMDTSSLARVTKRQRATIRARCTPVACDVSSGHHLFNVLDSIAAIEGVRTRARRKQVAA